MIKECCLQEWAHKVVGIVLSTKKELVKKSHVEGAVYTKHSEHGNNSVIECFGCHVEHFSLEEQMNGAYYCPVHCVSGRQRPLHVIF